MRSVGIGSRHHAEDRARAAPWRVAGGEFRRRRELGGGALVPRCGRLLGLPATAMTGELIIAGAGERGRDLVSTRPGRRVGRDRAQGDAGLVVGEVNRPCQLADLPPSAVRRRGDRRPRSGIELDALTSRPVQAAFRRNLDRNTVGVEDLHRPGWPPRSRRTSRNDTPCANQPTTWKRSRHMGHVFPESGGPLLAAQVYEPSADDDLHARPAPACGPASWSSL